MHNLSPLPTSIINYLNSIKFFFCLLLLAGPSLASEALIDQYGSLPTYRSFDISPNGKHYAFIHHDNNEDRFLIMDAATQKLVGGFKAGDFKARTIHFANDEYVTLSGNLTQAGWWRWRR